MRWDEIRSNGNKGWKFSSVYRSASPSVCLSVTPGGICIFCTSYHIISCEILPFLPLTKALLFQGNAISHRACFACLFTCFIGFRSRPVPSCIVSSRLGIEWDGPVGELNDAEMPRASPWIWVYFLATVLLTIAIQTFWALSNKAKEKEILHASRLD